MGKVPKIVYGQVPSEPNVTWKQVFPVGDSVPADIRGMRVKIEISTGYTIPLGPGHQTSRDEIDIAK